MVFNFVGSVCIPDEITSHFFLKTEDSEGTVIHKNNKIMSRTGRRAQTTAITLAGGSDSIQLEKISDSIELEEVKKARKFKNGISPGVDGFNADLLRRLGENRMLLLHRIVNEACTTLTIPKDWKTSVIVPIFI